MMYKDLNITSVNFNKEFVYADYLYGKHKQHNFPISQSKTSVPLELVRSDVLGLALIYNSEGFRYYVHLLDDFTRFTWIFPLRAKFEVKGIFTKFHKLVENQFDRKIKTFQSS